ncbi:MAG: hypothetical protein R3Y27_08615, partial [Clostridia bacterium]
FAKQKITIGANATLNFPFSILNFPLLFFIISLSSRVWGCPYDLWFFIDFHKPVRKKRFAVLLQRKCDVVFF